MEIPASVGGIGDAGYSQNQKPMQMPEAVEGGDYEVFLNFRGPDTRTGITDHLYCRLKEAGVRTYRDNEELRIGEKIGPELLGAIEQTKISIPIFSKGYASSEWCLNELTHMVECRKRKGQIIMPLFYHVKPSEVRYQKKGYGKALLQHENKKRLDDRTIRKWKEALSEAGALKGWDTENEANRHEGELVKQVVTKVLSELKKAYLVVSEFLVRVEDNVKEVMEKIGTDTGYVKIMGLYGMGGIGKTTLAKVVYNQLSRDFASCCFLPDVRDTSNSKGIVYLQNRLISDLSKQAGPSINYVDEGIKTIEDRFSTNKVLILVDDVDDSSQLTALLGRRPCFGFGSQILITTRNASVLQAFQVKLTYSVGGLDYDGSLQLFSKHAFRRDNPPIEKLEQSKEIVKIAQGLPLLLEVMGSTLLSCGPRKEMWDDYLEKWKKGPIKGIRNTLMISYEALDRSQREIFLDIACFFVGYDKNMVIYMWKDCGLCPIEGLEVLQLMSLIKIGEDNKLWMHDQFKDLGREIVSQESGGHLENQSRQWDLKDALNVLQSRKRNEKLQALRLMFDERSEYHFTLEEFAALPNLRSLHVHKRFRFYYEVDRFWHRTKFLLSKSQILPDLRWLSWHGFAWLALEISNFSLSNLVILDFSCSNITCDWDGWRHIKRAKRLKVLDLSECKHLTRTPDFSGLLSLERLILQGCERLAEIDSSIGQLHCLALLNLNFCPVLHSLPKEVGELPALTELFLNGTSTGKIPYLWGLEDQKSPHVQISPSAELGDSLNFPTSLWTLSLDKTPITHLPDSIGALTNLKSLYLNRCLQMQRLPDSLGKLRSLTEFSLSSMSLVELPDSMESLENLKALKLSLPEMFISALPKLPKGLTSLAIISDKTIAVPDYSNLINLKLLLFITKSPNSSAPSELAQVPKPLWIETLSKLEVLTLSHPRLTNLSPELSALPHLKTLQLFDCCALDYSPQFPSSITKLHIGRCPSLTTIDIFNLKNLSELYVFSSPIKFLRGRQVLDNLRERKIYEDDGQYLRKYFVEMMSEQHGLSEAFFEGFSRRL